MKKENFDNILFNEIERNEKLNSQIYSEAIEISKKIARENGLSEYEINLIYAD